MSHQTVKIEIDRDIIVDAVAQRLDGLLGEGGVTPIRRSPTALIGSSWMGGKCAGLTMHDNLALPLLLLPGEFAGNWKDASAWAEQQGGYLPSRVDALILFQNLRDEFKPEYYWTAAQRASNESCAWMQGFNDGFQYYSHKDDGYRARAVRRIAL